jgi:calcineurin-like phosphoesterase family protein
MKTFFIGDTHFNHTNVMMYEETRLIATAEYIKNNIPGYFDKTVEKIVDEIKLAHKLYSEDKENIDKKKIFSKYLKCHDEMLIKNWNETVSKEDTVYVLGDFAFGDKKTVASYSTRLNGKKILILGNHDHKKDWYANSFAKNEIKQIAKGNITDEQKERMNLPVKLGFVDIEDFDILKRKFLLSHYPPISLDDAGDYVYIYGHVHGLEKYPAHYKNNYCVSVEKINFRPTQIKEYDDFITPDYEV